MKEIIVRPFLRTFINVYVFILICSLFIFLLGVFLEPQAKIIGLILLIWCGIFPFLLVLIYCTKLTPQINICEEHVYFVRKNVFIPYNVILRAEYIMPNKKNKARFIRKVLKLNPSEMIRYVPGIVKCEAIDGKIWEISSNKKAFSFLKDRFEISIVEQFSF